MKTQSFFSILSAIGLSASGPALATTASSDPVGFVTVTALANSDAMLAVPLNRTPEFKGTVASIAGNVITVSGTPGWTNDQFVQSLPTQTKTFAIQFASGTKEGLTCKITANSTTTLTVEVPAGEDLTGIVANEQIDVIPYWTPASLFSGVTIPQGAQILLFNGGVSPPAGTNLASTGTYGYDSGAWVDENTFDSADHTPIGFGRSIIFRNPSASPIALSMVGSVPMSKHRILISTLANNVSQDVFIGYSSPIPEAIGNLGIGFAEDDQLLVFDNGASGINKSAAQVLFYTVADGWLDDSFNPVGNTFLLQPGQGYVFRKKATPTPTSVVWSDLQGYLQ